MEAAQGGVPGARSERYGGFWVVSDYEGNHEVLKHPELFTRNVGRLTTASARSSIPKAGKGDPALPLEIDPPAHIAVRQLLNRVMSPNAARALQSRIEYWTTRHIDAVMHVGACDLAYDITSI
jgi:cytochrome P450